MAVSSFSVASPSMGSRMKPTSWWCRGPPPHGRCSATRETVQVGMATPWQCCRTTPSSYWAESTSTTTRLMAEHISWKCRGPPPHGRCSATRETVQLRCMAMPWQCCRMAVSLPAMLTKPTIWLCRDLPPHGSCSPPRETLQVRGCITPWQLSVMGLPWYLEGLCCLRSPL